MKGLRRRSYESFARLPLEKSPLYSKYAEISAVDLDGLPLVLPEKTGFVTQAENDGSPRPSTGVYILQKDAQITDVRLPAELTSEGVILEDLRSAIEGHAGLVKPYLMNSAIAPDEDKFAALNSTFFSSGVFLYVPHGLAIHVPIVAVKLITLPDGAVVERNLLVVGEDCQVTYVEECYQRSPEATRRVFHGSVTEVHLADHADLSYATLQNLGHGVFNFENRRALCGVGARISWTSGSLGGGVNRSRVDSVLRGDGAGAEDVEVVFGSGRQRFDFSSDLVHIGTNTTGHVVAKGVLRDRSRSIFKGMIRIAKNAKYSNAYLAEHAMLLTPHARADSIPGLEIETNEVKATHSASVAQVDEEQVFYLTSRGLSGDEAKKMIVMAFFEPATRRIALPEIRRKLRLLLEKKWSGEEQGYLPTEGEISTSLAEIEEEKAGPTNIFERHYKYR